MARNNKTGSSEVNVSVWAPAELTSQMQIPYSAYCLLTLTTIRLSKGDS